MKRLVCLSLLACGNAPPVVSVPPSVDASTVSVDDAAVATSAPAPVDVAPPVSTLSFVAETSLANLSNEGLAFTPDGTRVAVMVRRSLLLFDTATLAPVSVPHAANITKAPGPLLVVGAHAFDPTTWAELVIAQPAGLECGISFSANGARMAAYCQGAGKDGVRVIDTRTGALLGTLGEFQTAAPVRVGEITASGNFVFWSARASGAFEEISSKVTGPVTSSRTSMSPDERWLFTTPDRGWVQGPAVGTLIDAKNGKTVLAFAGDVTSGAFSPSSKRLAVYHGVEPYSRDWVTIHAVDHSDPIAKLPDHDVIDVAFSLDDQQLAVTTNAGKLRLYRLP